MSSPAFFAERRRQNVVSLAGHELQPARWDFRAFPA